MLAEFRDLWIELTMVMQENEEVKGMSDRKFFLTLEKHLDAMCQIGQFLESS